VLIVAALGGNALLRRGEPLTADLQRRNVTRAIEALAPLAREHELVVTHGNGPQVGLLALQAAAYEQVPPYPLDVLGAESEGMIGYLLEQELGNALPGRPVATLLTQVVVDPDDRAFARPTKPIGPVYAELEARRLAREREWTIARDGEAGAASCPRRSRSESWSWRRSASSSRRACSSSVREAGAFPSSRGRPESCAASKPSSTRISPLRSCR
jgi:carbamate kinase